MWLGEGPCGSLMAAHPSDVSKNLCCLQTNKNIVPIIIKHAPIDLDLLRLPQHGSPMGGVFFRESSLEQDAGSAALALGGVEDLLHLLVPPAH